MKRLKLNLDQLGRELEILDNEHLRGIKGGWDGGYGAYGGYNSWEELWEAMQNGYIPPEGDYDFGGYGDYGWEDYGNYGGYNGGWPGWYPPEGDYGGYDGGGYGGYGGYEEPFPTITFNALWNSYPPPKSNGEPAHPSQDGYANQCAIRLGKALKDAFYIDFTDSSYTEQFGPVTSEGLPRGAKSLADYLERNMPGVVKKMLYSEWQSSEYRSSQGIIFIKGNEGYADHIDVYNNGVTGSGMYSGKEVWFFPLGHE